MTKETKKDVSEYFRDSFKGKKLLDKEAETKIWTFFESLFAFYTLSLQNAQDGVASRQHEEELKTRWWGKCSRDTFCNRL